MAVIRLGGDISKGYADLCYMNPAGTKLAGSGRVDDTAEGHAKVRDTFAQLRAKDPECRFEIGVEATGGLERNWLQLFHSCLQPGDQLYRLNPLAVKQFRERELHHNTTDPASAKILAQYLHSAKRVADLPYAPQDEGALVCCRLIYQLVDRQTEVKNQLQGLLVAAHPDLVAYCRNGLPHWVLTLLQQYPTAAALRRARVDTVARIPYITRDRATALVAAAQSSVASLTDAAAGGTIAYLVGEIQRLDRDILRLRTQVSQQYADDGVVRRLRTLPGVGLWTAVVLRLELGDFTRFRTAASAIAFAGLDPRIFTSGDGTKRLHISKRGRSEVRAVLYLAVWRALRHPGPLRAYYLRLRKRGKLYGVAMTAAMGKLLRWAYACVLQGEDFDADRSPAAGPSPEADPETLAHLTADLAQGAPVREELAGELPDASVGETTTEPGSPQGPVAESTPTAKSRPAGAAITAPVSRREAQRRRAAPTPPASGTRQVRGRGATHTHRSSAVPGGTTGSPAEHRQV